MTRCQGNTIMVDIQMTGPALTCGKTVYKCKVCGSVGCRQTQWGMECSGSAFKSSGCCMKCGRSEFVEVTGEDWIEV